MATWAGKSVIAFRMLGSELGLQRAVPTTLEIDASAVTDGAAMERVSRQQRFQAARIAMHTTGCSTTKPNRAYKHVLVSAVNCVYLNHSV